MANGVSSAELYDVSFAGATVQLQVPDGSRTITNFMDDANPIEFPDVEVSGAGANLNGQMIRHAKPNLITCSMTVMPKSPDENFLYNTWMKYRVQNAENKGDYWEQPCTLIVNLSSGASNKGGKRKWILGGGTMLSGPGGPASTAEGKMQGRTYTFTFATVSAT